MNAEEIIEYVSKLSDDDSNITIGKLYSNEEKLIIGYCKGTGKAFEKSTGYTYEIIEEEMTEDKINKIIEKLKGSIV